MATNWFWIPKSCCWKFPPSGVRAATRAGRWRLARTGICISALAIIPIPLIRMGLVRWTSGRTGAIGTPSAHRPTAPTCAAKSCASSLKTMVATVFLRGICSPRPKKDDPRFTSWACATPSGCRLTARAAGSIGAMSGPDARQADPQRGPIGLDEWNQARAAGNFGWPYCIGDNQPLR